MNFKSAICFFLLSLGNLLSLSGCASHPPVDKRSIPEVDALIRDLRTSFKRNCLNAVLRRDIPSMKCQNQLFDMVERQFGTNYTEKDLWRSADHVFLPLLDQEIARIRKDNPKVNDLAIVLFRDSTDLVLCYRNRYSFQEN